jgi:hypothetical protein
MATEQLTSDPTVQASRAFLERLIGECHPRDFAIRFWDGAVWKAEPGQETRFTLLLQQAGTLRKMFWPPDGVASAEAYVYEDFDVEGDNLRLLSLRPAPHKAEKDGVELPPPSHATFLAPLGPARAFQRARGRA